MPNAICPHCGSASFACEFKNVKNLSMPIAFIYCTSCLVAIGCVDALAVEKLSAFKEIKSSDITSQSLVEEKL